MMPYKGTSDVDPHVFVGGLRYRRPDGLLANYTAPFAHLKLAATGIRIEPSGKLAVGMSTIELPWESIARAERVRGALMGSPGVRIVRVGSGDEKLVFWTFDRDALLHALEESGVTIEHRGKLVWFGT